MCEREESRIGEKLFRTLLKPISYLAPQLFTTPVNTLVNSMISKAIYTQDPPKKEEIVFNDVIFEMSEVYMKARENNEL